MALRFFLIALISVLSSCSSRQPEPFRIVQLCIHGASELDLLSRTMKSVAESERMTFIDNTKAARRGLAKTAQSSAQAEEARWVISFVVQKSDGLGVTATNLGLSPSQIALGFTSGRDSDAAQAFADRVVKRLDRYWTIIPVETGKGAERITCRQFQE